MSHLLQWLVLAKTSHAFPGAVSGGSLSRLLFLTYRVTDKTATVAPSQPVTVARAQLVHRVNVETQIWYQCRDAILPSAPTCYAVSRTGRSKVSCERRILLRRLRSSSSYVNCSCSASPSSTAPSAPPHSHGPSAARPFLPQTARRPQRRSLSLRLQSPCAPARAPRGHHHRHVRRDAHDRSPGARPGETPEKRPPRPRLSAGSSCCLASPRLASPRPALSRPTMPPFLRAHDAPRRSASNSAPSTARSLRPGR